MLKSIIGKITGISEERQEQLKAEIEGLLSRKRSLQRDIQALEGAKVLLNQKTLGDDTSKQFLVGTASFVGPHEAGHSIYEIRVDGVDVPIRTKIQDH